MEGSLFTETRFMFREDLQLWTHENFAEFRLRFNSNDDRGRASFEENLEQLFRVASAASICFFAAIKQVAEVRFALRRLSAPKNEIDEYTDATHGPWNTLQKRLLN